MPQSQVVWTLEMVHALPDDGNRYELLDGELLVSPAPSLTHQRVLLAFYNAIYPYTLELRDCEVLIAPAAVTFSARRELQPDLLVLPLVNGRSVGQFTDVGRLLLAMEVLSPNSIRNDRYKKRRVYQQEGVPETWIVDPPSRLVERWRATDADPEVLADAIEWQPRRDVAPLLIDLPAIFGRVFDQAG